jgi:hypothetical protein
MSDHTLLVELCPDLAVEMERSRSYISEVLPAEDTGIEDRKDTVDIVTGFEYTVKYAGCGYTNQM